MLADNLYCSLPPPGLATTILLEVAAPQLIASVGVRDAALVPRAVDYMRVRAWAQPAVLLSMVAQSGGWVDR
jgi:Na+-driven multidrug efflux pump